jgi:hypothetical protein
MGVNYNVALHSANWPTMQALQQCIDRRGWPVRLGSAEDPRWTLPLDQVPRTLGLPIMLKGEPIELEASIVTLSPTRSFGYALDVDPKREPDFELTVKPFEGAKVFLEKELKFKPLDINETLTRIGATDVRFNYGDRVLALTLVPEQARQLTNHDTGLRHGRRDRRLVRREPHHLRPHDPLEDDDIGNALEQVPVINIHDLVHVGRRLRVRRCQARRG